MRTLWERYKSGIMRLWSDFLGQQKKGLKEMEITVVPLGNQNGLGGGNM